MKIRPYSPLLIAAAAALLSACSHDPQGVRILSGSSAGGMTKTTAAPIRALSGSEISAAVTGKTFQYTRTGSSGFVTYNADGTLTVQDDQKGKSVGKWTASGAQYCDSYGPAEPMQCGEFKNSGNALFAMKTQLIEMKV